MDEEITLEGALYILECARREMTYHLRILKATQEGLDDCIALYGDDQELDEEGKRHVGAWAHRMHMATASLSEATSGVSAHCQTICELVAPTPPKEKAN